MSRSKIHSLEVLVPRGIFFYGFFEGDTLQAAIQPMMIFLSLLLLPRQCTKCMEELKSHEPKNVGDVRKLLGLLGYYRRYIENFSRIAKPIYDLLKTNVSAQNPKVQSSKTKTKKPLKKFQVPSKTAVIWEEQHKKALNFLIDCLTSPPVMAYPDFSLPFILHTDASEEGLGAVLYQKQNGKMRVIGYASRTLNPAERKYHLHSGKLEFLALKWAITESVRTLDFRPHSYLYFTINIFKEKK